ncbi:MAG: hypothetical protein HC887_12610, partial [Desulfobacteraceae bacterium]|nr:hypothetical protein [Desulfobacteraceae bacterium]
MTWTITVTNNGTADAEMVRLTDSYGAGLTFNGPPGVQPPPSTGVTNDFYENVAGNPTPTIIWDSANRSFIWEISNLAVGATKTYTLKTTMGTAACDNDDNRKNTVTPTWHCVNGTSADGDIGTNENTCDESGVAGEDIASVIPTVNASASISASNIGYCTPNKSVTITIVTDPDSNTLYDLDATSHAATSVAMAICLYNLGNRQVVLTATNLDPVLYPNPVIWTSPPDNVVPPDVIVPAGLSTYTFNHLAKSVKPGTTITIQFEVSSSCYSTGDVKVQIAYKDCCNTSYTPAASLLTVNSDGKLPNLSVNITKNVTTPARGQDVTYTLKVTNNATAADMRYGQIKAQLPQYLEFQSAATPAFSNQTGGVSSGVKCDVDGDISTGCGDCSLSPNFANGYLIWDLSDLKADGIWQTDVVLKFNPPATETDCTKTELNVSTFYGCPDSSIQNWSFDGNSCTDESGCDVTDSGTNTDMNCSSLGDFVWYDTDGDGVQDGGEPDIGNVEVQLWYPGDDGAIGGTGVNADVWVASTTTDTNGKYGFDDLVAGNYYVKFIPAGYFITQKDGGSPNDDTKDSDADQTTGMTQVFSLAPGPPNDLTWDAGMYMLDFGDLPDTGAGIGAGNYQTNLSDSGARHIRPMTGSAIRLGLTDPDTETDGHPGINADGDDTTGSDDENGITFLDPIMPGQTYRVQVVVSSGTGRLNAWIDFNGDGDFTGEQINNGTFLVDGTSVTNVNDTVLSAGTHTLTFTAPTSTVPFATTLYSRFRITADLPNQYEGVTPSTPSPIGLAYSGEVEDYALMSLGDLVWIDNGAGGVAANANNGIKDGTEVGVSGVEVRLLDNSGNPIPDGLGNPVKTTTDSNGRYLFTGLKPGSYKVYIPKTEFGSGGKLENYFSSTGAKITEPPTDKDQDTGIDQTDPASTGITSNTVQLNSLGSEPTNDNDT